MTTTEHPEPEDLSAFLDGEAPEWGVHVDACPRCQAELARLGTARGAVGRPVVSPPPSVVDAAVARALHEAGGVGSAGGGDRHPLPLRRRSRAFVVGVASGSVAAVLLAVLAAFAVVDRGEDRTAVDTALAPGRDSAVQDRAAAGAAAPPAGDLSGGEDLGEVGDPAALAARLGGRIPRTEGAPVPMAAAPAGAPAPCELEARGTGRDLGPLVYAAGGSCQGQPVVVLGFGPGSAGPAGVSLLVLARDGCELVYATSVS